MLVEQFIQLLFRGKDHVNDFFISLTLRKKCPYSEFFWSVFSRFWTEYGKLRSIFRYSVQIWENTDQNNPDQGHSSHGVTKSRSFIWVMICSKYNNPLDKSLMHNPVLHVRHNDEKLYIFCVIKDFIWIKWLQKDVY